MTNEPRRRGWTGWLIALLILLPLLWIGYWYAVQQAASAAIERVTTQPLGGGRIACAEKTLGGFPLRLDFACPRASFARGNAGGASSIAAELGGLSASAPLYWPGYVEARLDSPFVVNAPSLGVALTAAWSDGSATASAGIGGLKAVGASFHAFDFANSGDVRRLPLKTVKAATAAFDLAPAASNGYHLAASAEGLTIVPASGQNLPAIDAEARLTALDFGSSLGTDLATTVMTWLRRGSTADIEHVRLATGGAVLDSDGQLTLGANGLLTGRLQVRFRNPEAFARLAESIRPGSGDQVLQGFSILTGFTTQVQLPDGPARQVTLNLRNGIVAIGIIPVGSIPPLIF